MSNVVEVTDLSRHHRAVRALDGATFTIREHGICGLLGRNGAGKTTVMRMIAGQDRPTAGRARVFGEDPWEHDAVLSRICFVKESQRYADGYRVDHVLRAGALVFPDWDVAYADALIEEFALPRRRAVKKLSRGMLSAVGIVIGLASRAPLTCFDEPYLGLDAVARQRFYDLLLADMAERPRTIILSTHMIDEVADLIDHVVLLDEGRVILDEEADALRGQAVTVTGPVRRVESLMSAHEVLHREDLGGFVRLTLSGALDANERSQADELGLDLEPVSLQQLVVRRTTPAARVAVGSDGREADWEEQP